MAHGGGEVAEQLASLDIAKTASIGAAARDRVLREHTYALRAQQVEMVLQRGLKFSEAV